MLDDSEFSDGETREAADIQGLVRKSTKQKKVAFNDQTPAAPTINNDERGEGEEITPKATPSTASTTSTKPTSRAAVLECPVPGCAQLRGRNITRRMHVLNHQRNDHTINIPQFNGAGGNMTELQKRQEDAVRAWLQGRSMATDSPFFLTA